MRGRRSFPTTLASRAARTVLGSGSRPAGSFARLLALREAVALVLAPADVEGTARRFQPVVSELLRAGLAADPRTFAALASGAGRRSLEVAQVAMAYVEALDVVGAVDPAELMWRAASAGPEPARVLVSGYSRFGDGEVAFLAALAAPGSVAVLPAGFAASEAAATQLAARGWSVERDELVGDGPGPRLAARFTASRAGAAARPEDGAAAAAFRLADEEDEVRFALSRVQRLLADGVPAERIVLVARDERGYGPLVKAVGAEFGVPVRLAYSLPLRETRLGEVVSLLLEAVGSGLPFETTARAFRHPLTRALPEEAWSAARARHPSGPREWESVGVGAASLLEWPAEASSESYLELLRATLAGLGTAELATGLDGRALRRLAVALREAVPAAGSVRVSLGAFLARVRDVLDVTAVAADPWRRGTVELHTPLAVFGARYDHVLALGLSEGVFPEAAVEDPVIDLHERRALAGVGLALEDAQGAAEREELSFLAVLHAAGSSVTLTCPDSFGGTERLPSPLFAALGVPEPSRPGPRRPASPLEELIATLPTRAGPARSAWEVERRREGADAPDAHDGVVGLPLPVAGPFSATQLTSFGQCSFKWFAGHGLGLREPLEAEDDVSPATVGTIYHETLKLAVERARSEAPTSTGPPESDPFRAAVVRHLPRAYDDAHRRFEELGTRVRSATWSLQRRENLDKLSRLVMSPDFVDPGARVSDLEVSFTGVWRGLRVRGFVDRIDVVGDDGDERLVFTDYKLGKAPPKGAKSDRGTLSLDVQLSLYVEAAAPALHPGRQVAAARYLSVNGASVSKAVDLAKLDGAGLDALVSRFVGSLAGGAFPIDPDPRQEACAYCAFDIVCRRGPRLSRKMVGRGGGGSGAGEDPA